MNNLLKKVELYGEKSLSDLEILFILFGKRNVKKIMVLYENVFNDYGKYSNMYELTTNELVNTSNVPPDNPGTTFEIPTKKPEIKFLMIFITSSLKKKTVLKKTIFSITLQCDDNFR